MSSCKKRNLFLFCVETSQRITPGTVNIVTLCYRKRARPLLLRGFNVKYGQFVEPGQTLTVTAQILKQDDRETKVKAQGTIDGRATVGGRLVLARYNLADTNPQHARIDEATRDELRKQLPLLYQAAMEPSVS